MVLTERANIGELVRRAARDAPDAPALLAPARPAASYRMIAACITQLGQALADNGVRAAHRVAVALPNGPELAAALVGVASHAICVPLDPLRTEAEFRATLEHLGVDALIVPETGAAPARLAAASLGIPCLDARTTAPARVLELSGATARIGEASKVPAPDVALLLQTSGTTSRAKRVPLTHAMLLHSAASIGASLRIGPNDRCLSVMPLFHVHGLVGALLASLHAGASVACVPAFEAGRFVEWLRAFSPSWYTAVPTIHQAILDEIRQCPTQARPRGLRFVRSSSAALPPRVARALEAALGVPVIEAYGMTEATHQIACQPLPPEARRPGSVGRAAGAEIAIVDATGMPLPPGTSGEIVVRGDAVIVAYDAEPGVNAAAFRDGWLRTGDVGTLDDDGVLRITGRLKEMINRGGAKIAPQEVEAALLECDDVLECAVFAVPHATLGEDAIAAVVAKPGACIVGEVVRQALFGRIAESRIPSRVLVVDALPKGPTGKILRLDVARILGERLRIDYAAPREGLESTVAALFAEVLETDVVGRNDNFFVLGGDSLRGGQLVARIRSRLAVELAPAALFRHPTPAELASEIARTSSGRHALDARAGEISPSGDDEAIPLAQVAAGDASG
jgi:acyl-CoA synthetase (AMP-forming)/AMP-acid ligase II